VTGYPVAQNFAEIACFVCFADWAGVTRWRR